MTKVEISQRTKVVDLSGDMTIDVVIREVQDNLTHLKELYLQSNPINGSIPPELGNIHSLENLDLSHNFISGEAPVELVFIDNL
jgi:Leucine-rich repeat (LRR) protein